MSCTINACWRSLWPENVNDFKGFSSTEGQVKNIIHIACKTDGQGFTNMTEDDEHELLASHNEEPTNEELQQMLGEHNEGDSDDDEDITDGNHQVTLTTKRAQELIRDADKLCGKVANVDPFLEHSLNFKRGIQDLLIPYKVLLKHLTLNAKQQTVTPFFRHSSATSFCQF